MVVAGTLAYVLASACAAALAIWLTGRLGLRPGTGADARADRSFALAWAAMGLTAIAATARAARHLKAADGPTGQALHLADGLVFIVYAVAAGAVISAWSRLGGLSTAYSRPLIGWAVLGTAAAQVGVLAGAWTDPFPHAHLAVTLLAPVLIASTMTLRGLPRGESDHALVTRARVSAWAFGIWGLVGVGLLVGSTVLPAVLEPLVRMGAAVWMLRAYPEAAPLAGYAPRPDQWTDAGHGP